jgi:hypothetical protein
VRYSFKEYFPVIKKEWATDRQNNIDKCQNQYAKKKNASQGTENFFQIARKYC